MKWHHGRLAADFFATTTLSSRAAETDFRQQIVKRCQLHNDPPALNIFPVNFRRRDYRLKAWLSRRRPSYGVITFEVFSNRRIPARALEPTIAFQPRRWDARPAR